MNEEVEGREEGTHCDKQSTRMQRLKDNEKHHNGFKCP